MSPALDREPTEADRRLLRFQGVYPALWKDRTSPLVLSGGAGTAKTLFCLNKVLAYVMKYPGSRALICRKTKESLVASTLVSFENQVLPAGHHALGNVQRESRQVYRFRNGSEIAVGGMQRGDKSDLARIMGTEYDVIYCNELREFDEDNLTDLQSRNRHFRGEFQQIIGDTNPWSPTHWIKRGADTGLLKLVYTTHKDNPAYWNEAKGEWTEKGLSYVEGTLKSYIGVKRDRLYLGRWVQAEGVVYEEFDPRIHVIAPGNLLEKMPEGWQSWRKVRSIDFGYSNPFVCQWWAIDNDGRMYLYREIYFSKRTVKEHAERINQLSRGEEYEATVCDHYAEDRATLRENGIANLPARKAIDRGKNAVKDRLKVQGDGKPRIYFLKTARVEEDKTLLPASLPACTVEEFDCYINDPSTTSKNAKELPLDKDNHGMDAMRYAVLRVDRNDGPYEPPDAEKARLRGEREESEQAMHDAWLSPENPAMWPDEFDD